MNPDSARLRMGVLGVVVISLFAALLARLWYLQVLAAPELRVEAQQNSVRVVVTEAVRGRILDRNGKVLVDNRVVDAVTISRDEANRNPGVLARLSVVLGVPEAELRRRVDDDRFSPFKPAPIAEEVPEEKLIYIREHQADFPGVDVVALTRRNYPAGPLAAHLLGYVGEINDRELAARKDAGYKAGDTIGKSGVEAAYETELRGQPRIEKLEVDSKGQVLGVLGVQPAVPGRDVQLTVDLDAQRLAEESLAEGLERARSSWDRNTAKYFLAPAGAIVVLDPRGGSVVAMASYPSYDPREFVNGISESRFRQLQDPAGYFPLNDRALQGLYAPGSTFKLVSGLAAMRNGLVSARDTILDTGSIQVGNPPRIFRNARGQVNGRINMAQALTVSSDVFFYEMGKNLWEGRRFGPTAMQEVAVDLGLGARTGIELPFEVDGRIPTPESRRKLHDANPQAFPTRDWFTGDNMNLAVGQGEVVVTPLQLATAYATFANGGTVYAPRVAGSVLDPDRRGVRPVPVREVRRVELPPSIRQPLLDGFKGVVSDPDGTAFGAFAGFPLNRFPVAGKTGTAEVFGKQDTALFSAFAPADNPQYVVTVVMEESGFGAAAAAPVARRVLEGLAGGAPQPVQRAAGLD
ncbi:MAG TPA: penicillin-binding protein 2 [Acidimicrobiales bacterium]|nr:penicillin-binding protein 2 [Acidimicrobiales bacterium]